MLPSKVDPFTYAIGYDLSGHDYILPFWIIIGPQRAVDRVHPAASALAHATWCTAPTSSRHGSDESAAPVNTRSAAPVLQNSPLVFNESTRSPF